MVLSDRVRDHLPRTGALPASRPRLLPDPPDRKRGSRGHFPRARGPYRRGAGHGPAPVGATFRLGRKVPVRVLLGVLAVGNAPSPRLRGRDRRRTMDAPDDTADGGHDSAAPEALRPLGADARARSIPAHLLEAGGEPDPTLAGLDGARGGNAPASPG